MSDTLSDYIERGIIRGDAVLTPEVQDRMAYQRLLEAGLGKYRNKQLNEKEFQWAVANAWRTVEAPGSTKTVEHLPASTTWKQIMDIIHFPGLPTR